MSRKRIQCDLKPINPDGIEWSIDLSSNMDRNDLPLFYDGILVFRSSVQKVVLGVWNRRCGKKHERHLCCLKPKSLNAIPVAVICRAGMISPRCFFCKAIKHQCNLQHLALAMQGMGGGGWGEGGRGGGVEAITFTPVLWIHREIWNSVFP